MLALVLVIVTLTFLAPGRAEADVLATAAIVTLVVIGVMIITYLVIANVAGSRQVGDAPAIRVAWLSCPPYDACVPPVRAPNVD